MPASDRIERQVTLPVPADEVWRALTEDLSAWFGARAAVERVAPGAHIEFTFDDGTSRAAVIEEAEPGVVLAFRWLPFARRADGTPESRAVSRVEMRLEAGDEGSVLTILEVGASTGTPPGPLWAMAGGRG